MPRRFRCVLRSTTLTQIQVSQLVEESKGGRHMILELIIFQIPDELGV